MAIVIKAFPTRHRRFAAGSRVTERDDLSPQSFDRLVDLGFIERLPVSKARKATKEPITSDDAAEPAV